MTVPSGRLLPQHLEDDEDENCQPQPATAEPDEKRPAGGGKGEGTVELSRRAQEMEKARDLELNKYHNFEFASAAFQIGIVLASATVITGILALAWASIGVGLLGVLFMTTGFVMPTFPHDVLHWVQHFFEASGGEGPPARRSHACVETK